MSALRAILTGPVTALLLACGGGGSAELPDADISDLTYGPCAAADRVGGFSVELTDEYTGVQGQVFDSVLPTFVFQTLETDGDCRLVEAPSYACDPVCESTQVCNGELACVPYPVAIDVGTVSVVGLKAAVEMPPRPPNFFYTNPSTLPQPGFDPGAAIQLAATGGTQGSFQLRGAGIEPLVLPVTQVTVDTGQPVPLTWTPPADAGPARVLLSLNINGHGLIGSHIECEVADSGAFTIPAALVTSLLDRGVSGFPTLAVTRTTADSVAIDAGCVDLRVQTSVVLEVIIPGLVSCNGDEDCEPPQTCQVDLTCG